MSIIDTLEIYEDLKSQFKEEEARALTKALEKSLDEYQKKQESFLSTKDDIARLQQTMKDDIVQLQENAKDRITKLRIEVKEDVAGLRGELKEDIAALRGELKGDIAELRGELKEDINKVRTELANAKAEIIKWLFIFLVGQGATIISILKFINK